MSSLQRGHCPLCRASVQVKNFKRHWELQHERHEKNKYDEVFDLLKKKIMEQSKFTTATIDVMFESKRQRLNEENVRDNSCTVISHDNVIVEEELSTVDISSKSSPMYFPLSNITGNIDYDNDSVRIISEMLNEIIHHLQNESDIILLHHTSDEAACTMLFNEHMRDITNVETSLTGNLIDEQDSCLLTHVEATATNPPVNRPQCTKVYLPNVQFISDLELTYVDQQRSRLNYEFWLPLGGGGESKPSKTWFTPSRSKWLRAVHSDSKFGVLCVLCAKEARDKSRILQNQGTFICRPYWKLLHQGLEGILCSLSIEYFD